MRNTIRLTPMLGFTCAVGRDDKLNEKTRGAGIALGLDDSGDERKLIIAARHADGTTLTVSLGEFLTDRFLGLIADVMTGETPERVVLQ